MPKKGQYTSKEEKKDMDRKARWGCVVCRKIDMSVITPAEIHHIDGKTKKASEDYPGCHMLTIPLCYEHHREGSNNEMYVSRHPFKAEFVKSGVFMAWVLNPGQNFTEPKKNC